MQCYSLCCVYGYCRGVKLSCFSAVVLQKVWSCLAALRAAALSAS